MTVSVGLVGLGMMGRTHLAAYREHVDFADVAAVCDVEAERLRPSSEEIEGNIDTGSAERLDLGGAKTFTEFDQLLTEADIDIVDLCVPTYMHASMAIEALGAGKHVFCEKPMALTIEDAEEMVAAAEKAGKLLMIGHCLRFWPEYVAIKEMIDSGKYGKALAATLRRLSPTPGWSWQSWILQNDRSGQAALDLHIHDVDTIQWFFGPPSSVVSTGVAEPGGGFGHIVTQYRCENGPMVVAEGGWGFPPDFPFSMSATVMFAEATVQFDTALSPALAVYPAGGGKETPAVPAANAYAEELKYFVSCAASGNKTDRVPPAESARAVAIVAAEIASARTGGKPVKLGDA